MAIIIFFFLSCNASLDEKQDIIKQYQAQMITEGPSYRVYVNRMTSDFANDVLAIYKTPNKKLCYPFCVKFENETSVGVGPVREFFSLLMSMIMNGFPVDGEAKPLTLVFEGEVDHKTPVANSLMRSTGFYKAIGRMIAHSFLHGGPPVFGLSKAVIEYLAAKDHCGIPNLEVADIPDIDLRNALTEVQLNFFMVCITGLDFWHSGREDGPPQNIL